MPVVTLSAEFVRNAVCPEGKSKENYYDTGISGWILECRASGSKTYALRYKDSMAVKFSTRSVTPSPSRSTKRNKLPRC
jgi:hypothetical protein